MEAAGEDAAEWADVERLLRKAARRRRALRAWEGFWKGFWAGAAAWLACLAAFKALPLPWSFLGWSAAVCGAIPAVWAAWAGRRIESLWETSRWLDRRLGLEERLATAVEWSARASGAEWTALLRREAARRLRGRDWRGLLPLRLPAAARRAAVALALATVLGFVPEYRSQAYRARVEDQGIAREVGRRLVETTQRSLQRRRPALQAVRKNLERAQELGKRLETGKMTRERALDELAKAAEQLRKTLEKTAKTPGFQAVNRALQANPSRAQFDPQQISRRMAALEKELGNRSLDLKQLEALQQATAELRRRAAQAGASLTQKPALMAAMSEELAALAEEAAKMGLSTEALKKAIEALRQAKPDQLLKALDAASIDLEKLLQAAKKLEQLKAAAAQIAKTLPEQLAKGQVPAAIGRMRWMTRRLRGGATAKELQALAKEIGDAVGQAGPYGPEVKEALAQAARKAAAGERAEAAKALEKAAKALEKLLEQIKDAQQCQAALAALQRAQMCIGNRWSWSQCQAAINMSPFGVPNANRIGPGVGTWSDGSLKLNKPPNTGMADNSGFKRPEMTPRGISERNASLPQDRLLPTRVKGQFQPGGPVASVSLRGLSLRGESRAAVKQVIEAAQEEAQRAMTEEEIPRPYQSAVKAYFDQLQ